MPQIVFEVTRDLAEALDFPALLRSIHDHFAAQGYAPAAAIRSRVVVPVAALSGTDAREQFVIATMKTTVARPPETEEAMAQHIHDALRAAIAASGYAGAWQCGVFREYVPGERYIKSNSGTR
jgi:5-carboxymethyl-2-hydroxymuconate isomerase